MNGGLNNRSDGKQSHQLLVEQQDFFLQLLHLESPEGHLLVTVLHFFPQVAAVQSFDVVWLFLQNKHVILHLKMLSFYSPFPLIIERE